MHGPLTSSFEAAADMYRQEARRYRRRAWRCLWIPTLYFAVAIGVGFATGFFGGPKSWIVAIVVFSAGFVFACAPTVALAFFLHAMCAEGAARRNERAIKEVALSGDVLLQMANKSRRTAEWCERWWRRSQRGSERRSR